MGRAGRASSTRRTPSTTGTASSGHLERGEVERHREQRSSDTYTMWPVGTYRASLPPSMSVLRTPVLQRLHDDLRVVPSIEAARSFASRS